MVVDEPKFLTSPFFVPEPNNWHLKEGAPDDVKEEFLIFMEQFKLNK